MYSPRVPRICRERRGVLSSNVCMYYEWRSTVELTYNAHLECSAYRRIRQAAMSFSAVWCVSIGRCITELRAQVYATSQREQSIVWCQTLPTIITRMR